MGLFDQIINAVENPNQAASTNQLTQILNVVQQLSQNYGTEPGTVQTVLSIVGNYVRSALQQQATTSQAQAVVQQYSGTNPNPEAVYSLFSPQQQQEVAQAASQQTGLGVEAIRQMLPSVVPIVLNLLQSGASNTQNPQAGGLNPVLGEFLHAAEHNNVDIAAALQQIGHYLGQE